VIGDYIDLTINSRDDGGDRGQRDHHNNDNRDSNRRGEIRRRDDDHNVSNTLRDLRGPNDSNKQ
jgi:hypothetical protein